MRRRRNKVVPVRRPWFMGRLFMAAANNPMLRFSPPGDPDVFPASNVMSYDEMTDVEKAMMRTFVTPAYRQWSAVLHAENERYRAAGLVPPYVFVDFNTEE